ncbi:MAG TPA: sugar phosphate isomerase/epimerase family protein [bacterium]|nr:sugar phosphate isomerase/epimerase family protein [bacterium]
MKLGMCSWSHHRNFESGDMDIFEWMAHCASDLKVGGIEITDGHLKSFDEDYVRKVRRVAVDLHLTISALTISNDFGKADAEERDKQMEYMEQGITLAMALGTPVLRVFAGWPEREKEEAWSEMVRCMQISCMIAEREGVVLAVENHNHGGFLQTFADVDRLMKEVDSEWLRLNLDTGNFIDGFESIEKGMFYNVHTHAKMLEVGPSGSDALVDYPRFINLCRDVNYRGFISIEYEGKEDEVPAVRRGVEYIRSLIMGKG